MEESYKAKVKKLGTAATFFTLIKGFIATGCLYLPKSFVNGGYGFQILSLILSAGVTMHCSSLLL
jgi:amino acid permease